jgi:hypothetical protein
LFLDPLAGAARSHSRPLRDIEPLQMSEECETEQRVLEMLDEESDIQEQQQKTSFDIADLGHIIKVASEGAITGKTFATYQRYVAL